MTRPLVITSREPPQRLADRASSRVLLADAPYLNFSSFHYLIPTQELAAPELCVVVLECWDDDTVTGDDFLGTVAVPLAEVTAGKQLDLPLLAATLAPWPRKHGTPSLQVTFDLVYADARGPSGGLA